MLPAVAARGDGQEPALDRASNTICCFSLRRRVLLGTAASAFAAVGLERLCHRVLTRTNGRGGEGRPHWVHT